MKYCTFKYTIAYADGDKYEGWSPFYGQDLSKVYLAKFVDDFFKEARPAVSIEIYDLFEISNSHIWITHIRNTVEFRYLYIARGFASELLKAYYPQDT